MNTTRRDTIKSILAAAAVSAVPAVAKAAIDAKPLTKADSIYAKIKALISECEKERGLPFDPQRDGIHIWLPSRCPPSDLKATENCFLQDHPNCLRVSFNVLDTADVLDVNIHRIVEPEDSIGAELYEIDPTQSVWSVLFLQDGQMITSKY